MIRSDSLGRALLAAVLLCAGCGGGSSAPALEAAASVVAAEEATNSLGFDVDRHGWAFENYAASGSGRFGVADAITLFGDEAVCVEDEGSCTPTPAAAEWIDMVAASMGYGVCEGMTVASVDRFLVDADPETGLLAVNNAVERQLARLFATQFLDDVITATERWRTRSVADIVTELQASLADPSAEQYTLGVYSPVGGHSVLPYAVDLDAVGRGVVYVYDPNWPGEKRYIEVDTAANRWRFSYFSPDQTDDPEAWTGGSGLMDLTPLSVREAPFPEPFKGSGTGVKQLLAISSSTRNWTLTNADGGALDGQSVIPGRDGVVAITRGAPLDRGSQRTDVVLVEWVDNAELKVLDGVATLSLFTDAGAGSVVVSDEATIKVEVPADPGEKQSGLEIQVDVAENTDATVTVASATERVRVTAEAGLTTSVQLAEASTKIEVTDAKGANVVAVEVPRSDERIDVAVDRDGDIEIFTPESIDVEERVEAVETSTGLLVADDIKSRTVEATSLTAEKVKATNLRVDTVDKVDITAPTLVARSDVMTDSREITENEVADIQVDEAGESATLLLADGSKVEVRISSNGDVMTSDGRTVDITIKPDPDTLDKDSDRKQQATEPDDSAKSESKTDESLNKKDTATDKDSDRKQQATEPDDSAKSESKTDDKGSDFKLDDRKR